MAQLHLAEEKSFDHDGVRYRATLLNKNTREYEFALEAKPHEPLGRFAIEFGDGGKPEATAAFHLRDAGTPEAIAALKKICAIGNAAIAAGIVWREP